MHLTADTMKKCCKGITEKINEVGAGEPRLERFVDSPWNIVYGLASWPPYKQFYRGDRVLCETDDQRGSCKIGKCLKTDLLIQHGDS